MPHNISDVLMLAALGCGVYSAVRGRREPELLFAAIGVVLICLAWVLYGKGPGF
jgi:hypothetical protein